MFRELKTVEKCLIFCCLRGSGPGHPPHRRPPTHYFLQFSGKVIALGKPQPMLLGYEQIIPATIDEAKKLNYDSEASIREKCILF